MNGEFHIVIVTAVATKKMELCFAVQKVSSGRVNKYKCEYF